jgi:Ca2+-binding RTX toxin-like protein
MPLTKIFGTEGADYFDLSGQRQGVLLKTLGGNDKVVGTRYGDRIHGGDGNDLLRGREGNDEQFGGAGSDTMYGGSGFDKYWATGNRRGEVDTIRLGAGDRPDIDRNVIHVDGSESGTTVVIHRLDVDHDHIVIGGVQGGKLAGNTTDVRMSQQADGDWEINRAVIQYDSGSGLRLVVNFEEGGEPEFGRQPTDATLDNFYSNGWTSLDVDQGEWLI